MRSYRHKVPNRTVATRKIVWILHELRILRSKLHGFLQVSALREKLSTFMQTHSQAARDQAHSAPSCEENVQNAMFYDFIVNYDSF